MNQHYNTPLLLIFRLQQCTPSGDSKFGLHSRTWICQHCTYENEPQTRVCLICDRTSDKPKYVDDICNNITDDDKWNGSNSEDCDQVSLNIEDKHDRGSLASPRNIAVNFQQDAEQVVIKWFMQKTEQT